MREDLTQTFHQVLASAQGSARQLNQDFVGTEHLILGLLQSDGEAAHVLHIAHANPEQFTAALTATLPRGDQEPVVTGNLPLSPKAQRIVNGAIVIAQSQRQTHVSSRFLLLSLLEEPQSLIRRCLQQIGADIDTLQSKLVEKPSIPEA